jgi:hypothetical protein
LKHAEIKGLVLGLHFWCLNAVHHGISEDVAVACCWDIVQTFRELVSGLDFDFGRSGHLRSLAAMKIEENILEHSIKDVRH